MVQTSRRSDKNRVYHHEAVRAAFVKLVFDYVNETTGRAVSETPIDLIRFRSNEVNNIGNKDFI